jgi:hypothetical protein
MDCAGQKVCLDCSDLWEVEEIKLHHARIRGALDKIRSTVNTASGYSLPFKLFGWMEPRWPWQIGPRAYAVDLYGRNWMALMKSDEVVTLKPIGRRQMSRMI